MSIPMPGYIVLGTFVSFVIFYYYKQKARIRREKKRSERRDRHQAHLDSLLRDLNNKGSNATDAPLN